jgi:hypothetical protein
MHTLDLNERVEADDGYIGEDPVHVKTPSGPRIDTPAEQRYKSTLRMRHETVNKRIKTFGCLSTKHFRHDAVFHSGCFRAVAVLIQLSIERGHPLF